MGAARINEYLVELVTAKGKQTSRPDLLGGENGRSHLDGLAVFANPIFDDLGLARQLGVSKPVVTRALNTLGTLGYLRRERDQDDRRNVFVVRTNSGAEFLEGFKRYLRAGDEGADTRSVVGQRTGEPAFATR